MWIPEKDSTTPKTTTRVVVANFSTAIYYDCGSGTLPILHAKICLEGICATRATQPCAKGFSQYEKALRKKSDKNAKIWLTLNYRKKNPTYSRNTKLPPKQFRKLLERKYHDVILQVECVEWQTLKVSQADKMPITLLGIVRKWLDHFLKEKKGKLFFSNAHLAK